MDARDQGFYHDPAIAQSYAACRPDYPAELFQFISGLTPTHQLAWDCGTGNGQAARFLAPYFDQVIGTDHSLEQLGHARHIANVRYEKSEAGRRLLADASVDLITAAQAVHWFHLDAFYGEVRRVLRPSGVLAVWGYRRPNVSAAIDEIITKLWYCLPWPQPIDALEHGYRDLPFPFAAIPAPPFEIVARWTFKQAADYLTTWPWIATGLRAEPAHEIRHMLRHLELAWGPETRETRWPLHLRVGRPRQN